MVASLIMVAVVTISHTHRILTFLILRQVHRAYYFKLAVRGSGLACVLNGRYCTLQLLDEAGPNRLINRPLSHPAGQSIGYTSA
ncbi:hypothetical protein BS17DRAFT_188368 [Gyrodon lividus]|nr:hypothetical protein BS17DRAFT_188368 [Gyrodon lividus]